LEQAGKFASFRAEESHMSHRSQRSTPNFFRKFGFFTLFTILFTLVGYSITMGLFRLFSFNISGTQDWNLLSGFVGVLTLSFLVGGLVTSVIDRVNADVVESREKAKLSYDIYQDINVKLTDPEQEAARRWILVNIAVKRDNDDSGEWYAQTQQKIMAAGEEAEGGMTEGQRAVKMTLNLLDYIGFIAKNYWDIEDDSLDWLGLPIAKIWRRIGPYVAEIRRQRNARDYYVFAEYIGNLCIEWRQKRGLPDEEIAKNTL
jgi:hypothetical protein